MRPSVGLGVGRLLTLGWVVVSSAVVVSAVEVVRTGWAPVIDNALIAAMTVDSVGLDPPLVGMPTSIGLEQGAPLSHPGPLGFWLLAIPTKVLGEPGHGLIVGSTLLALAAVAGVAVLLRRRGDFLLEALGLALVSAMVVSMGAGTFASPFNPYLGVLPLLLCVLAVWGVLSGRHRQLWVVVLAGSVAAQTHLGYVLLVAALVALTSVSLAVDVIRSSGASRRRLTRRIIPVGVVAGLLCWIGPILDQLFGTKNLTRLLRSQSVDRTTTGLDHGLDVAVEMTSFPPRWLLGRARDQDLADPSTIRVALSLTALAFVVAILVWTLRRRDRTLASLSVVCLVSLVVATITSSRLVDPTTSPFFKVESAVLYRLFWWPVGLLFALTVLWGSCRIVSVSLSRSAAEVNLRRLPIPLLVGLVAGIVLLLRIGYVSPADAPEGYFSREVVNAEAIADLPGSPRTVVLRFEPIGTAPPQAKTAELPPDVWDLGPNQRYGYAANLVAQLRLRGITVRFSDETDDKVIFMRAYRTEHRAQGDEPVVLLYLVGPNVYRRPPSGYRRISVAGAGPGESFDALTVPSAVYIRS